MFAYVPARIGSKRIPKKNIKLIDGKPLIYYVLSELSKVPQLKGIAVSSDSIEVLNICNNFEKVITLELRKSILLMMMHLLSI